jgi:predicted ester cyclase
MVMNKNEEIARKAFKIWETGNLKEIDELTDVNFKEHTPDPTFQSDEQGVDYVKDLISKVRDAFSDLKININDVITNETKAVVYSTWTGKHTGTFNDIPPSNNEVKFNNIDIVEIKNGKITGHWGLTDNLSLLMQMGVIKESELHPH